MAEFLDFSFIVFGLLFLGIFLIFFDLNFFWLIFLNFDWRKDFFDDFFVVAGRNAHNVSEDISSTLNELDVDRIFHVELYGNGGSFGSWPEKNSLLCFVVFGEAKEQLFNLVVENFLEHISG